MFNGSRQDNLGPFDSQMVQKRLEANQKSLHLQITLGRTQLREGKLKEGIETYFTAATKMVLTGKLGKAAAIYKLILQADNDNPMALALLSSLYHHQGLEAEARQLQPALKEEQARPKVRQHLLEDALRPLFISGNDLDLPWIARIAEAFQVRQISAQELLIKEGERHQTLYVILEGHLQVSCQNPDESDAIPITTLKAGDFFGEFSLLTGEAASATVRALTTGWIASLKRREIDRLAAHFPEFLPRILKSFRARKQSLIKQKINHLSNRPPQQAFEGKR